MQALILSGGKGTRLASRLEGQPKPLVDVAGRPLLDRQLDTLARNSVSEVVLLVNHRADHIAEFCATRAGIGPSLRLIDDGHPRGTAGAVLACLDELADRFIVVYGDTLFEVDLAAMIARHEDVGADLTLLLHPNDHPADSDLVEVDGKGWITRFHSYPHSHDADLANLVNAALYVVEKAALLRWAQFHYPSDLAKDLFPAMAAAGAKLYGYRSFEYIRDIGTPARLDRAVHDLASNRLDRARLDARQACVFVDRDGTINEHDGYVSHRDQLALLPGAAAALRRLNRADLRVAVITNQPVVARGECSEEELAAIHRRMEWRLGEDGAFIDGLWWCPHHPDSGFVGEVAALKMACDCRKPGTALVDAAGLALNADRSRSWFIGDSTADMLAAQRSRLASILVGTGEGGRDGKNAAAPWFRVPDLEAAVSLILDEFPAWSAHLAPLIDRVVGGDVVTISSPLNAQGEDLTATLRILLDRRGLASQAVRPADLGERAVTEWLSNRAATVELAPSARDVRDRLPLRPDDVLIFVADEATLPPSTARRLHRFVADADRHPGGAALPSVTAVARGTSS